MKDTATKFTCDECHHVELRTGRPDWGGHVQNLTNDGWWVKGDIHLCPKCNPKTPKKLKVVK